MREEDQNIEAEAIGETEKENSHRDPDRKDSSIRTDLRPFIIQHESLNTKRLPSPSLFSQDISLGPANPEPLTPLELHLPLFLYASLVRTT